jgi:hypothetical protein
MVDGVQSAGPPRLWPGLLRAGAVIGAIGLVATTSTWLVMVGSLLLSGLLGRDLMTESAGAPIQPQELDLASMAGMFVGLFVFVPVPAMAPAIGVHVLFLRQRWTRLWQYGLGGIVVSWLGATILFAALGSVPWEAPADLAVLITLGGVIGGPAFWFIIRPWKRAAPR